MPDRAINILVVDDSASLVDSLIKILQVSGYNAEAAYNGHEALHKLSDKKFDVVICDIEMPGMNGLELLKHVRHDFDDIAFILITGYQEQDYYLKAIQLGASDFIRKPIDGRQMLRAIQVQLNKKKEDMDYFEVSNCVSFADIKLSLPPYMFRKIDFIKIFTKFFKQNMSLSSTLTNELLLCLEEMLYNAFIHGTLNLSLQERTLSYDEYKVLVMEKLKLPQFADKKIHLRLSINQASQVIVAEVEDEGDGFNYAEWLMKIRDNEGIQLDEYGRGISIIYHLADRVSFAKGGRIIRIEKNFNNAAQTLQVAN
jgi:YesN/AraC family two-component response regulator